MQSLKFRLIILCFACLTTIHAIAQDASGNSSGWYSSPLAWWSWGGILFLLLLLAFIRNKNKRKN